MDRGDIIEFNLNTILSKRTVKSVTTDEIIKISISTRDIHVPERYVEIMRTENSPSDYSVFDVKQVLRLFDDLLTSELLKNCNEKYWQITMDVFTWWESGSNKAEIEATEQCFYNKFDEVKKILISKWGEPLYNDDNVDSTFVWNRDGLTYFLYVKPHDASTILDACISVSNTEANHEKD